MRSKCRLFHVVVVHAHFVVAGVEVELGERGIAQLVEQLLNDGDQELVFNRDGIKGVIVTTMSYCFFSTSSTDATKVVKLGRMTPWHSIYVHCHSSSCF
jgi:hypothetical protein